MTPLVQKATSATKWSALDVFMRQGVQFVVTVILARILVPEDFGIIAVLTLFIGVATVFADCGLGSALVQRQNTTHTDESTVFFFNIGMGAVCGALLCMAAPWIASFFDQPLLQYLSYAMALNLFVGAFGSIHTTLLNKEMNFQTTTKVGGVSSVLAGAVAIYMASQGYGVWSLVGHTVVSGIVTVVLLWVVHPWRPGLSFSSASLRSLFRFGGYEMVSTLLDVFVTNLYAILIGKMYSVRDVGLFARARNTQLVPVTMMLSIVQRVAYSTFSSVSDDKARLVRGLRQAQAVAMFVNLPIMVGVIVLAEPLVLILFGEQWLPCVPMLQVLGLGGVLWPLSILNLNVLRAQGHSGLRLRIEVIKKVVAISLTVAASYYGIMAIAWAQVVISVCTYYANTHYTKVLLAYSGCCQLRDLSMNFVAVVPMATAVYLMADVMHTMPVIEILVAGTLGFGIYLLTCRFLCAELLNQSLVLTGVRTNPVQT